MLRSVNAADSAAWRRRQQMKLTVVAATGGIGEQVLEQALAAGHEVTAVVRNPGRLPVTSARVVAADLAAADPSVLLGAVAGADAVLSGLGPRSKAETGVAWHGTRAITQVMDAAGVRRIVVVSAAPVGTVATPARPHPPRRAPGDGFVLASLAFPVLRAAFGRGYADLAQMEDMLRGSDLEWTAVRPVRLTGRPLTGRYRTAIGHNVARGLSISRADVAHCMLRAVTDPATCRQTVGIAY
jgi:putative NADH-flavin reductase